MTEKKVSDAASNNAGDAKDIVIYVSDRDVVQEFKRRCKPFLDKVSIGAFGALGKADNSKAFDDIAMIMSSGKAKWTIFDLESCDELVGESEFIEKIKWLIRNDAHPVTKSDTFIIDRVNRYDAKIRSLLAKFMVKVVDDETMIGKPFSSMLSEVEADIENAAEQSEAFSGLADASGTDKQQLPGIRTGTPDSVDKTNVDPFAGLSSAESYFDPFESIDNDDRADQAANNESTAWNSDVQHDPFEDFDLFGDQSTTSDDNHQDQASNNGAETSAENYGNDDEFADAIDEGTHEHERNGFADLNGFDLFGDEDQPVQASAGDVLTGQNIDNDEHIDNAANGGTDGVTGTHSGISDFGSGSSALNDGNNLFDSASDENFDPFAIFPDESSGLGSMITSSGNQSQRSISNSASDQYVFDPDELAGSAVDIDPFADYDDMGKQSEFSDGDTDIQDWYNESDDDQYAGEVYDDPDAGKRVEVLNVDDKSNHDIWNDNGTLKLDWLFDKYGDLLGPDDVGKLVSMREPVWDYTIENDEGVGNTGGIAGLLGGKGKISQVDASMLADSNYIAEKTARDGYYAPPDTNGAKIILSYSSKGGTGKALADDCMMHVMLANGAIADKRVDEITTSDKLFGSDGKPYAVKGIYKQGVQPVYEVRLSDGRSIEASSNHIWRVIDDNGNERDTTTAEILETWNGDNVSKGACYFIPMNSAVEYCHDSLEDLSMPPYDYGADLADNSIPTTAENSRIASSYMHASIAHRRELLSGLLHEQEAGSIPNEISMTCDNAMLVSDIAELLRSLGYYTIVDGRKINAELGKHLVCLEHVSKTGMSKPCTCFEVDSPDHLFLAGDFIVTHNTTVSVMTATQLNWYFNSALMQHMTASINSRVLLMSFNEFDDLPAHEIGYDNLNADEMDNDGKNVLELLRRINQTEGMTTWDDISHCFAVTPKNMVFYLPPLTQKQAIEDDITITAEDYRKILSVLSKFFSFIVIDSPDIFYREKEDLMNFAFSVADVILFVLEASFSGTNNLRLLMDSLHMNDKSDKPDDMALDPRKCILVVNKYVDKGNPYISVPEGQIKFEDITKSLKKYFARFVPIPYSKPRMFGNVLFSTDSKVKYQAAELADDILEVIDENDERIKRKNAHRRPGRR